MNRTVRTILTLVLLLALTLSLPLAGLAAERADPAAPANRAAVIQRLYEREGQPMVIQSVVFPDAAGTDYANAAVWAFGAGVVIGDGDGNFHGARAVTRAELAAMLYRYARYRGRDVSAGEGTDLSRYSDAPDVPAWCDPAFRWALAAGVVSDEDGALRPNGTVTQRELGTILTGICGDGVTDHGGADALADIQARGVLRVGATGDYRPMSFREPDTGEYWGFDAELAEDLAAALGVTLEYVPTTWPTLMDDTLAGKFDLAICGITITDARREQALMSEGYLDNGKTVLCRAEDAEKYTSLEAINRPEVTVMENPGGLNEKFARENLPDATIVIHDVNEEIPGLVAAGAADVMITEILEAGYYVGQDERLAAPLIYEPFTRGQLGALMPRGSETLLDFVNSFLAEEIAGGRIDELANMYIYGNMESAAQDAA